MGLNYYIPIYGAKKSGASKMSSYGTTIGLVVGLIAFPPFGFIIGALLGAFIGELIANRNNVKGAFKASLGSFVGFMVSTGLSLMACVAMLILVITNIGCDLR